MTQQPEQEHIGSVAVGDSREARQTAKALIERAGIDIGDDHDMFVDDITESLIRFAALSRPVQEPVAKRWLVEEALQGGSIRWKTYEHEHIARMAAAGDNKTLTPLYAAPQPAHGTSATERVPDAPAPISRGSDE